MPKRITSYILYVGKEVMTDPTALFDAAFAYFIKKANNAEAQGKKSLVGFTGRKRFIAQFQKAPTDEMRLEVIDHWVAVRDAKTFPFRKELAEAGLEGAEAGSKLRKELAGEDKEAAGGVPMDDEADGEPESGAASE